MLIKHEFPEYNRANFDDRLTTYLRENLVALPIEYVSFRLEEIKSESCTMNNTGVVRFSFWTDAGLFPLDPTGGWSEIGGIVIHCNIAVVVILIPESGFRFIIQPGFGIKDALVTECCVALLLRYDIV